VNRGIPVCEILPFPKPAVSDFATTSKGGPTSHPDHYNASGLLDTCDPHKEHVWEEASDADENKILISRGYKPGSVLDRLEKRYA
jgi:hypothetical protein